RSSIRLWIAHEKLIRPVVEDNGRLCRLSIENRAGGNVDLINREPRPYRRGRIHCEEHGRPARGAVHAIIDVDDGMIPAYLDVSERVRYLQRPTIEEVAVRIEKFHDNRLRLAAEIADCILQHLDEFGIQFRLASIYLRANVTNDFVDAAAAFALQLH